MGAETYWNFIVLCQGDLTVAVYLFIIFITIGPPLQVSSTNWHTLLIIQAWLHPLFQQSFDFAVTMSDTPWHISTICVIGQEMQGTGQGHCCEDSSREPGVIVMEASVLGEQGMWRYMPGGLPVASDTDDEDKMKPNYRT